MNGELISGSLRRRGGWERRLADYLAAARSRMWEWGSHDCAQFALGAIAAVTGTHPMPAALEAYTTRAGAAKWLLAATGTADYAAAVDRLAYEWELYKVPTAMAWPGDIARCPDAGCGGWPALGVVESRHAWFARRPYGIEPIPMAKIDCAWRIA